MFRLLNLKIPSSDPTLGLGIAIALTLLVTATATFSEQPSVRANDMDFFCASGEGWKDGACGFVLGCIISEAFGLFDCYQVIDGNLGEPVDLTVHYGFENPFMIDAFEQIPTVELWKD